MMIRKIDPTDRSEIEKALALSLEVFMQCGRDDFNNEGVETFKSFIHNRSLIDELTVYAAFEGEKLIGMCATKNAGRHISLFFVRPDCQRRGIGKKLFAFALHDTTVEETTVHSSSYAVPFYRSLGFEATGEAQVRHGLKSYPMKRISSF